MLNETEAESCLNEKLTIR